MKTKKRFVPKILLKKSANRVTPLPGLGANHGVRMAFERSESRSRAIDLKVGLFWKSFVQSHSHAELNMVSKLEPMF